jgi:hemolysin activation/secretion protein
VSLWAAPQTDNVEGLVLQSSDMGAAENNQTISIFGATELRDGFVITAAQPSEIEHRLPQERQDRKSIGPEALKMLPPPPLREGGPNTFVLSAVEIGGANAFTPEAFAPLYDDLLARPISLNDVSVLVDAITAMYRQEGYFLSRAVAPAQSASSGVLRIDIAEGYIAEVVIKGDAPAVIKRQLEQLTKERPLRLTSLDRTLALIGDLRGIKIISSQIEPDPLTLARHKLVVEVNVDSLEASLYTDNRGTDTAGPVQAYARIAGNSLLKTGDQLSAGVFFIPDDPNALILGELSYQLPLTGVGTYATLSGMISRFDAGASLAALDTQSRTRRIAFSISHPLIRRRKMSLWGNVGIEGRNIEEQELGVPQYDDKLRVFYASANFKKEHWNGVTSVSGRVNKGLNMLGASNGGASLSRPDADGAFTKFNTQISRYQNIGKVFGLYASFAGQTSLDPLLASEEFSLGGARYGRAYDYGELTGDDGLASLVELRYGRNPNFSILDFYQFYGFYDYGIVWNDNVASEFDSMTLSSAGAGLRLTFPASVYASFEIARPLTRTPFTQGDKDWRGFFSVSKSF